MRRFGFVAVLVALQSWPANAACGDRGRPGYRGPDNHCVSWLSLAKGACARRLPHARLSTCVREPRKWQSFVV
jgi:hypothetical protein